MPSALPPNPPNPQSAIRNPQSLYACLSRPSEISAGSAISAVPSLIAIAQEFSPRYERHRDDLVSVDVSGLTRLLGPARTIGEEMRREAAARGVRARAREQEEACVALSTSA